jgi:hypothetical protein
MKVREGFVSNSSTSSFVVLGYLLDERDPIVLDAAMDLTGNYDLGGKNLYEVIGALRDRNITVMYTEEDDIPKGKILIGTMVCDIGEGGLKRIELTGHMEKIQEVADALGTNEKPSLFTGIMMC